METPKVVSREYKFMLQAARFEGDEEKLRRTAREFWQEFRRAIDSVVIDTDGDLDAIEKTRLIRFYDTPSHHLNNNGYIFRERRDESSGDREVTLKFRHPDRYLAQTRGLETGTDQVTAKFEEDIKPPFQTLYSFSSKQKISANKTLNRLNDLGRLYPGLPKKLDQYDKEEIIRPVGNFTAIERVVTGADFQVDANPKVEAECALIAWYEAEGSVWQPVVLEFSFRYGDGSGNYAEDGAKRAYDAFLALQSKQLSDWADPASRTKTAYVYSLAQPPSG